MQGSLTFTPPPDWDNLPVGGSLVHQPRWYQEETIHQIREWWEEAKANKEPFARGLLPHATGMGKAQPLDAPILTPSGWKRMGDLAVGDMVVGSNGKPTEVLAIHPQGEKDVYAVRFTDHSKVECCKDHLWSVQTKSSKCRGGGFVVRSTAELATNLQDGSGANKWFLPLVSPVVFDSLEPLPIPPYSIGALIGDGCMSDNQISIISADLEIVHRVRDEVGLKLRKDRKHHYRYVNKRGHPNPVLDIFRALGLQGQRAWEKRIPPIYLRGSVEGRIELLRGLLDTDGTIAKNGGHIAYSTTSAGLAEDVVELVRSLGGTTRVRSKAPGTYTYKGRKLRGRKSYRVTVSLRGVNPFWLKRKASLVRDNRKQGQTKSICSIEKTRRAECQCITVAATDSLYVTEGYALTHNSHMALSIAKEFPELLRHGLLFLVEFDALVWQQAEEFRKAFPTLRVGIEKADLRADFSRDHIVVASVQSLGQGTASHPKGFKKRLLRIPPQGIILSDESHRIKYGGSFDRVLSHLGVSEGKYGPMDGTRRPAYDTPGLSLLMSATPNRKDGQGLHYWAGDRYIKNPYATTESHTDTFDLRFGIEDGWLVEPVVHHVYTDTSIEHIKVRRGQLDAGEVQTAINVEARNAQIVASYLKYKPEQGGHAIVFTAGVQHAHDLAELFREAGVMAESIHGGMDREEKAEILARFKAKETMVLTNDSVLTTGVNLPLCDMLLRARPTTSQGLYAQVTGRATRPVCNVNLPTREERLAAIAASTKPVFINIDFVDKADFKRMPLVTAVSLFGLPAEFNPEGGRLIKEVVERVEGIEAKHPTKNVREDALSFADIELRAERVDPWDVMEASPEILELSDNRWMKLKEGVIQIQVPAHLSPSAGEGQRPYIARAVQEPSGRWRIDRFYPPKWDGRRRLPEQTVKGTKTFASAKEAAAAMDKHIERIKVDRLVRRASGSGKTPTDKQVAYMKRLGFSGETTPSGLPINPKTGARMDAGEVGEWIDAMKSLKAA